MHSVAQPPQHFAQTMGPGFKGFRHWAAGIAVPTALSPMLCPLFTECRGPGGDCAVLCGHKGVSSGVMRTVLTPYSSVVVNTEALQEDPAQYRADAERLEKWAAELPSATSLVEFVSRDGPIEGELKVSGLDGRKAGIAGMCVPRCWGPRHCDVSQKPEYMPWDWDGDIEGELKVRGLGGRKAGIVGLCGPRCWGLRRKPQQRTPDDVPQMPEHTSWVWDKVSEGVLLARILGGQPWERKPV